MLVSFCSSLRLDSLPDPLRHHGGRVLTNKLCAWLVVAASDASDCREAMVARCC